jgi:hypothetical protein
MPTPDTTDAPIVPAVTTTADRTTSDRTTSDRTTADRTTADRTTAERSTATRSSRTTSASKEARTRGRPFDRPPRTDHAADYTRDEEEIEPFVPDLR